MKFKNTIALIQNVMFPASCVLLMLSLCVTAQNTLKDEKVNSILRGEVREFTEGSLIGHAEIKLIDNNEVEYIFQTDDAGRYQIENLQGTYQIRVSAKGFQSFEYAPVSISSNKIIQKDFTLIFEGLTEITQNNSSGVLNQKNCTCASQSSEENITFSVSGEEKNLYLNFGKKEIVENVVKYVGINISYGDCERVIDDVFRGIIKRDKYFQTLSTFANNTIFADEISINPKSSEVKFKGNITLFDGKKKFLLQTLSLNMKTGIVVSNEKIKEN